MRKIELKGDEGDQPKFTVVELDNRSSDTADGARTQEEAPAQDK